MATKILQFPSKKVDTAPLPTDFDGDVGVEINIFELFEMLRLSGLFLKLTDGEVDFTPPEPRYA